MLPEGLRNDCARRFNRIRLRLGADEDGTQLFYPGHLHRVLRRLDRHRHCVLVYSGYGLLQIRPRPPSRKYGGPGGRQQPGGRVILRDRLGQLFDSVGTRDVVEIAILAVAIYLVLRFLGKTRGAGIVRGLGLVVVGLFLVAQVVIASFDLTVLGRVLDYLLTTVLVGLLVIFQPELRLRCASEGCSRRHGIAAAAISACTGMHRI